MSCINEKGKQVNNHDHTWRFVLMLPSNEPIIHQSINQGKNKGGDIQHYQRQHQSSSDRGT